MPILRKKFKYKPISLKDIVKQMKQNIDLMIDLAYSAIKFGSKELADETYKIEQRIHELSFLLNFQIIKTQPIGSDQAKRLEPILVIGYSIDKISNALSDIARVVYINSNIADFAQLMWTVVPEPILKITINESCPFIEKIRKDIHFRSQYGVDLITIRRNDKWLFNKDVRIKKGDILIVKGERDSLLELKEKACDTDEISFELDKIEEDQSPFDIHDPEIKERIVDFRNGRTYGWVKYYF
ncbi:MAG: TrkA C-terminal domain-containing protein [Candidatus Lokiarchaeota archaeon]